MKKHEILKRKIDFNEIIKSAPFVKNKTFVIYIRKKENEKKLFGIAVSKSLGNAVVRNKLKRQVRTLIDEEKNYFPNERDYIIMIKRSCINLSYSQMKQDFKNLIKEIK